MVPKPGNRIVITNPLEYFGMKVGDVYVVKNVTNVWEPGKNFTGSKLLTIELVGLPEKWHCLDNCFNVLDFNEYAKMLWTEYSTE